MRPLLTSTWIAAAALLIAATAGADPRSPPKVDDTVVPTPEPDVWLRRLVGRYNFEGVVEVAYNYEGFDEHKCGPLPPDPSKQDNPPPPAEPYCSSIKGKGDCVGIGTGPGVQCILNVGWPDIYVDQGQYNLPGGVAYLDPAMILFGLDPGRSAITYLLVDNKGLPEGGPGTISGNRAIFKTSCVNAADLFQRMPPPPSPPEAPNYRTSPRTCQRTLRIDAKADPKVVHLSMDIEINTDLWTRTEMTLRRDVMADAAEAPKVPPPQR
jgi:hypothetical protein